MNSNRESWVESALREIEKHPEVWEALRFKGDCPEAKKRDMEAIRTQLYNIDTTMSQRKLWKTNSLDARLIERFKNWIRDHCNGEIRKRKRLEEMRICSADKRRKWGREKTRALYRHDAANFRATLQGQISLRRGNLKKSLMTERPESDPAEADSFIKVLEESGAFLDSCYLCGLPPTLESGNYHIHGLDRIDNTQDHWNLRNLKTCCCWCNTSKRTDAVPDFLAHVEQIHDWIFLKKRAFQTVDMENLCYWCGTDLSSRKKSCLEWSFPEALNAKMCKRCSRRRAWQLKKISSDEFVEKISQIHARAQDIRAFVSSLS